MCPVSSRQKKKDQDMNILLPQMSINYNKEQRQARAHIESTIGDLKKTFESLAKPWFDSEKQQDYLVSIAAGVHNFEF